MSTGAVGSSGWVISHENLKSLCPEEYNSLEEIIKNNETFGWDDFARAMDQSWQDELNVTDEEFQELEKLLENLDNKFQEITKVGDQCLKLGVGYYDEDSGDIYDEIENVDGCYFYVNGMEIISEPGKKFQDKIDFAMWIMYG